jgi:hypothetical protein
LQFSLGDADQPFNAANDSVVRVDVTIATPPGSPPAQWQGIFESGGDGTGVGFSYRRDALFDLNICNGIVPGTSFLSSLKRSLLTSAPLPHSQHVRNTGKDGFSIIHAMPGGWRDGIKRSWVLTVEKGTTTRRWR